MWISLLAWVSASVVLATPVRSDADSCRPRVEWSLDSGGTFVTDLFPEAGPQVHRAVLALVGRRDAAIEFEQVDPYGRVVTSPIAALEGLPLQINGRSLGLDQLRVENSGQAMELMQRTLLPAHTRNKLAAPSERFAQWIDRWRSTRNPDFLVGVSRMEIYQALGAEFSDDVVSHPVTQGSLVLMPASATMARPRLVVVLIDRPDQTGRWQVIGRVTEGLELLRELSIRPLVRTTAKRGPLARPVRATGAVRQPALDCR